MKTTTQYFWLATWALSVFGTAMSHAAEDKQTNPPSPPRSVFIQPASVKEGRDPFYPESSRAAVERPSSGTVTNSTPDVTSLKVRGISGTSDRLLAIINNHSFAVGEEGDVMTSSGRIHIRCLEIRNDSVTIEINGHVQNLSLEVNK